LRDPLFGNHLRKYRMRKSFRMLFLRASVLLSVVEAGDSIFDLSNGFFSHPFASGILHLTNDFQSWLQSG
jgi:hypothetical protein